VPYIEMISIVSSQYPDLIRLKGTASDTSKVCICIYFVFMAAMRSRCGHYIFVLWFLLSFFFSSSILSHHRVDVCHTSTHDVALVQI